MSHAALVLKTNLVSSHMVMCGKCILFVRQKRAQLKPRVLFIRKKKRVDIWRQWVIILPLTPPFICLLPRHLLLIYSSLIHLCSLTHSLFYLLILSKIKLHSLGNISEGQMPY